MDFYLMRHGEAVSETIDPLRPLSALGRQEVERVARLAVARNVQVSAVLHSGILRARQTAEIIAAPLCPPGGVRQISGLLPQDDPWIAKAELESAQESVLLVGHLPHMNRLAALLVHGDADRAAVEFAPATLVCCSSVGSQWKMGWFLTRSL
jgi:phosphohistidine phosphatase